MYQIYQYYLSYKVHIYIQSFQMQFKIKAGRFIFDKQSKKVKLSKEKGLIHIVRNQEQETHFKWASLETNLQQFDIIVFPGDAVFQPVVDKQNTYVLRFGMDDQRYFYWLQEKCDVNHVVKEINRIINYEQPVPNDNEMVDEKAQKKPQPDQPSKPEPKSEEHHYPESGAGSLPKLAPNFAAAADFRAKIAQNIAAALGKYHPKQHLTALTHLTDVITPEALNTVIKEFNQEQVKKLVEFMPEEHKDTQHIPSSIRSPQFLQALDVLSDALNSQNALPLFMELGLKQEFLQKNYGVEAFLLALVDKYKKKKQQ